MCIYLVFFCRYCGIMLFFYYVKISYGEVYIVFKWNLLIFGVFYCKFIWIVLNSGGCNILKLLCLIKI